MQRDADRSQSSHRNASACNADGAGATTVTAPGRSRSGRPCRRRARAARCRPPASTTRVDRSSTRGRRDRRRSRPSLIPVGLLAVGELARVGPGVVERVSKRLQRRDVGVPLVDDVVGGLVRAAARRRRRSRASACRPAGPARRLGATRPSRCLLLVLERRAVGLLLAGAAGERQHQRAARASAGRRTTDARQPARPAAPQQRLGARARGRGSRRTPRSGRRCRRARAAVAGTGRRSPGSGRRSR